MALPKSPEARLYYRAAKQRFDDSQLLLASGRTTGAVYLAGYTVECFLKALILANVAANRRQRLLEEFRGSRAHDIEWLGALYRRYVGATIPREITRHLSRVASWSTDLRYVTGSIKSRDADEFMDSVIAIAMWADRRM
jgi:HEPN domain-containing protein